MSEKLNKSIDDVVSSVDQLIISLENLKQELLALEDEGCEERIPQAELVSIRQLKDNDEISARIANALLRSGVDVLRDLRYCSYKDILSTRHLGTKSAKELYLYLADKGIFLKKNSPERSMLDAKFLQEHPQPGTVIISDKTISQIHYWTGDGPSSCLHQGDSVTVIGAKMPSQGVFGMGYYACIFEDSTVYLSPGSLKIEGE